MNTTAAPSPPPRPAAPAEKPVTYYAGLNQMLLRRVPADAMQVLDVGCAEGHLGAALRQLVPGRQVYGVERVQRVADQAATRLDRVFCLDVEREDVDLPDASLDCIILGDVLEHLVDPAAALRRLRRLLRPAGRVLCCVPNVQHHSVVTDLLRGDFQYQDAGLLDATHLRFFTYASFTKLLLDAGFAPSIVDAAHVPADPRLLGALLPLFAYLNVDPARGGTYLSAYQYVFEGTLLGWGAQAPDAPVTFVCCVNDDAQLRANLLASPDLRPGSPHEVLLARGASSAAAALREGLAAAHHDVVVLVHQDVYLPAGWTARFRRSWREAEARLGRIGVAGAWGVTRDPAAPQGSRSAGFVVDRHALLVGSDPLPAPVDTLDELLLAVPRDTPLAPDPALRFHLYGSDLALQARQSGLAAVALDALCFHNSLCGAAVPPAFRDSERLFREKWRAALPVATPCARIE